MLVNSIHKDFILEWNNQFPLDRWYRKKYNIAFNSIQHRSISYIDIYYEWLEDKMFEQYLISSGKENERITEYHKTGKWLRRPEDDVDQSEMIQKFDDLDLALFDKIGEEDEEDISE